MRWSISLLALAACVDSHHGHGRDHDQTTSDVADVVRVDSTLLAGNKTELVIHGPVSISDASGPIVTTGRDQPSVVDLYSDGGLASTLTLAPDRAGVVRLGPEWLRSDAIRAWQTDPQLAPKTVTLAIANTSGSPGLTIQLQGAHPVFPDDPAGQHHALLLEFTGATQTTAADVSGITVRQVTRASGAFTIAEIPNGSASDLALVAPAMDAAEYLGTVGANGPPPFDPDRAVVHVDAQTVQTLRDWQRAPHTVSFAVPGSASLALDGAHEIAIHGSTVELAFVQASVP